MGDIPGVGVGVLVAGDVGAWGVLMGFELVDELAGLTNAELVEVLDVKISEDRVQREIQVMTDRLNCSPLGLRAGTLRTGVGGLGLMAG